MVEWEVAVDEKGRIRIPGALVKEMGLKPPARIAVKRVFNVLIMAFEADGPDSAWRRFFKKMAEEWVMMSEEEFGDKVSEWSMAAMDEEGRVIMRESLMREMCLETTARIVVSRSNGVMIMAFESVDPAAAWRDLCEKMDERGVKMSEEEVVAEVHAYRRERRARRLAKGLS